VHRGGLDRPKDTNQFAIWRSALDHRNPHSGTTDRTLLMVIAEVLPF
jgi:hypothetical protein